ncbi:hypothetical protein RvY_00352-1 [Ramazzottius varieornatus]|uniref:Uncharacterized protein n=1 Tax=Ramazzottius varieornatus TaxID=947166 RepID=A0A1D1UG51_RAMVA|nr:hypothetical protein RvY_00352-1 [Ramazzottius varieornatus]
MDASLDEIAVLKYSVVVTDTATPKPCGLDECQEMDKQLANVASLKLTDIHPALLDEIFQSVDFLKLLIVRRVCSGWNVTISREAAPFLRQVAIAIDKNRSFGSMPDVYNIWQYAKNASTVVMFGEALKM